MTNHDDDADCCINIELLIKLFIKCPKFVFCGEYENDGIKLTNKLFEKLYFILEKQMNTNLNQIVLESPNTSLISCNQILIWIKKFHLNNFRLNHEISDYDGISSIFVTKADNITIR